MSSKPSSPLVSVVIVNWNGLADTKICLEHTRKQQYSNIELIVVDNGSTQDSLEYLRKQKDIVLVENPRNLGFTGGHIAGYQAATGDFILLLNNDAVMSYDYVEKAAATMLSDPAIAVVGGRAYLWNDDNPLFDTTTEFYAYQNINPLTAEGIFARTDHGIPQEANNVSGSSVLVRRSVIEEVGYLHDPFFAYYEESDLFARIKRAGYKVVYDPGLAIWHANGKTAERKGSSFGFYMMMRNRFRFAVRNFDSWSLARFLNFYLKNGVISTAKAVLRGKTHPMEKAYARAFLYNCFRGWSAFGERRQLQKQLGNKHNYNQLIVREQTNVSVVVACDTTKAVDQAAQLAANLPPGDEVVAVITQPKIITYAKQQAGIDTQPLRLCINRGFFKTHPRNIGAICARNAWILFGTPDSASAALQTFCRQAIYHAHQQRTDVFTTSTTPLTTTHAAAQATVGNLLLIRKSAFIAAGGLLADLSEDTALRALLLYGVVSKTIAWFAPSASVGTLPAVQTDIGQLGSRMHTAYSVAAAASQKPSVFSKFLDRHYHAQQVLNLIPWWFSPAISLHLKAARTKNILLAVATLNRGRLATELKHIRNERLRHKFLAVDLDQRKKDQEARLHQLLKHPEQTTVFIICRDRFAALRKLLDWFEAGGITRIVLIDNDSALPPLKDFLYSTDYQVLEMQANVGHTVAWSAGIIHVLHPTDFYLLTDPDVIPLEKPAAVLQHLYQLELTYPDHLKIGLGLKIDDLPDHYTLKKEVIAWESQFWKHEYAPGVYEAGVDTTFAIYKPFTYQYLIHPSLRTGEPFTARHLPWYSDSDKPTEEDIFYRIRADQNVNTWDKGALPERYVKELAKQQKRSRR